jgi:hypothetical protein
MYEDLRRLSSSLETLSFGERVKVLGDRCVDRGFENFLVVVAHLK